MGAGCCCLLRSNSSYTLDMCHAVWPQNRIQITLALSSFYKRTSQNPTLFFLVGFCTMLSKFFVCNGCDFSVWSVKYTVSDTLMATELPIRIKLVFSVLSKDTLTCGQEEPGIEPPTRRLVDGPLYLLTHSRLVHQMTPQLKLVLNKHTIQSCLFKKKKYSGNYSMSLNEIRYLKIYIISVTEKVRRTNPFFEFVFSWDLLTITKTLNIASLVF